MNVPKTHTSVVVSNDKINAKVYITRFRVLDLPWSFEPGQYASFLLNQTLRRSLSFATPPNGAEFEVCTDVTPHGPISQWIENAKPGSTISFLGPLGRFVVDGESTRKKIFVATGTGIGPIRSMILHEMKHSADIALYWGVRFEEDVFWHDEFERLAKENQHFSYTLTITRPTIEWKGVDGRVTRHMFEQQDPLSAYDYYLCGSREMVRDVTEQLKGRNVPEGQIKTELFY